MKEQYKTMVDHQPKNDEGFLDLDLQFFADEGGADEAASGEADSEQNNEEQQAKTFSQEDVNNLIARESRKSQEKILKQLGIEDFENAKEGFQKFKEWQESQKTEAEKQAEQLKQLEENYTKISNEKETLTAQLSALKIGVDAEAVNDVVVLAKTLVNDEVDMDKAIEQVLEKYPHFKGDKEEHKPVFSTGVHKKQPTTEVEKWINAFK